MIIYSIANAQQSMHLMFRIEFIYTHKVFNVLSPHAKANAQNVENQRPIIVIMLWSGYRLLCNGCNVIRK